MRELVMATIADQPDIEVVGEVQNETELADIVEQVQPDVLIIAMDFASRGSRDGKALPDSENGPERGQDPTLRTCRKICPRPDTSACPNLDGLRCGC